MKRIIVIRYISTLLNFIDEFEISAVYYLYVYITKIIYIYVRYTNYARIKYKLNTKNIYFKRLSKY